MASSPPKPAQAPGTVTGTKTRHARSRRAPGEAYFELVRRFPLRVIETDQELVRARTRLNELLDRDKLHRDAGDYLDILGDVIERYERAHHPSPPVCDVAMLRHFLDSRDLTCTEAARAPGSPSPLCPPSSPENGK